MIDRKLYRQIGRHIVKDNYDYFSFSGSGIEFYVENNQRYHDYVTVVFELESIITEDEEQYVAAYIDDEFYGKYRILKGLKVVEIPLYSPKKYFKFTFIKLNEAEISAVKIFNITINENDGRIIQKEFEHKPIMEFYGDSLTCGYGNLAKSNLEGYKTATQDVTQTYCYLTAKELGYEFSCVARSGISMAYKIYYPKLYKEIFDTVDTKIPYVCDYKVDIAVINVISNDNGALRTIDNKTDELYKQFYDNYLEIVEQIIERNKDVKLLFCYKLIDTEDETLIKQLYLVKDYIFNKCNKEVSIVKFNPNHDGASYHPSVKAHQENSLILIDAIKEILKKE